MGILIFTRNLPPCGVTKLYYMHTSESISPVLATESVITTTHYMDVWNWERYFNAAKSVLEIREESKGDTTIIYRMDSSDYMKELSRLLCEELLLVARKTVSQINTLSN